MIINFRKELNFDAQIALSLKTVRNNTKQHVMTMKKVILITVKNC